MGVLDKFLNVMRLNPEDDDDFYNEDYDYDDDYTEDEPKQTFRREKKRETVEKDYDSDRPKETPVKSSSKVTPIRPSKKQTGPGGMQVCVIKPTSVEDAREITETLLENRTVVLNVEGFDEASYQRNNLKQNVSVSNGDAVYKLISNEEWHIVVPITNTLADELADDNTLKLRFNKDGKTAYATYVITEKSGEKYLILTLRNSLVRYAKDRFIEIELLLTEQTGLKIPNSAITEKEFFTIPVSYFMKGGDSDADGLLVSSTNKNGKTTTEFVSPTIYYTTDDYYYIDSENVTAGDILVKPDSNETYRVGSDTATLKGVYNVNKGYAVFKQIDILYQSKEYTIVKTGTSYGISLYDHIALDGAKINEDDLLK